MCTSVFVCSKLFLLIFEPTVICFTFVYSLPVPYDSEDIFENVTTCASSSQKLVATVTIHFIHHTELSTYLRQAKVSVA
jgi:hypothetical protein